MARAPTPSPIRTLRQPTLSSEEQLDALKALKNDIIGHNQRKELAIRHGAIPLLVRILRDSRGSGKRARTEESDDAQVFGGELETIEEKLRIEAVIIAGALGNGGLAYVTPVIASGILQHMVYSLYPSQNSQKMVTANLRALLMFAQSLRQDIDSPDASEELRGYLYTTESSSSPPAGAFSQLLAPRPSSPKVHEQVSLVAQLICESRPSAVNQAYLVKLGVLDHLSSHLVAFLLAQEGGSLVTDGPQVQPAAELPAAPPASSLRHICEAILHIIHSSAYRTGLFLHSPVITSAFGISPESYTGNLRSSEPVNSLLPPVQASQSKMEHTFSKAWPVVGNAEREFLRSSTFGEPPMSTSANTIGPKDIGSPIFTWLIYLARVVNGLDRLAVLKLLTELVRATSQYPTAEPNPSASTRNRDRALAFLVVPLVVKLIDEAVAAEQKSSNGRSDTLDAQAIYTIKAKAPMCLALLIEGSEPLQKAAVDAGVIKKLCTILKKTFDPVPTSTKPMWTPFPNAEYPEQTLYEDDVIYRLGKQALPPETRHALLCRETSLRALAAVAEKKDEYRKAIIEQGVVSCIADSLIPNPQNMLPGFQREGDESTKKQGNPAGALIEACGALRALSRSVNILRTSLIDAGVATPVVNLLKHEDLQVQLAATDVLINLLMHFSPMKDDILRQGALKTLCDHAHSANPQMRFSSIWALKHLVLSSSNDIKMNCLEELGTGWLMQTITGETRSHISTPIGMGTPNAAGEQVDLLNAPDDANMDIDEEDDDEDDDNEDEDMADPTVDTLRFPRYMTKGRSASSFRKALKEIKDEEMNPAIREQRDDLRIQEVALDFVRNLMSECGTELNVMIDHVLERLGQQRLFDVLASKLRGKQGSVTARDKRISAIGTLHPLSNFSSPPSLLRSAVGVLIHIANGSIRHRSLLLSQANLLAALLPLFSHPDPELRNKCLWVLINLTWQENEQDRMNARARAQELKKAGFEEAARRCLGDSEVDVRERAKTVVDNLRELGGGESEWGIRSSR